MLGRSVCACLMGERLCVLIRVVPVVRRTRSADSALTEREREHTFGNTHMHPYRSTHIFHPSAQAMSSPLWWSEMCIAHSSIYYYRNLIRLRNTTTSEHHLHAITHQYAAEHCKTNNFPNGSRNVSAILLTNNPNSKENAFVCSIIQISRGFLAKLSLHIPETQHNLFSYSLRIFFKDCVPQM